ncbi:cupin domain-containing protein [Tengunoibacter tsumagoiensis]|uniref:Cupin type-2 domain-containing protein n=1 Tax=Tengunoibacter tsumagoiensis TaxID=2014871 RepID=A0A402A5U5_9CHLR|nr:cupin domain-containing protein [Tengunoibacter tsumagoiensis]GCE14449.1 hypothetical protein KTT_43080 [Tengunoibacter tsumagoiensis]
MDSFPPAHLLNLSTLAQSCTETYQNFVVNKVNASCLRMAVWSGDYPWHRHPNSDELFMVVEGELMIDFHDRETVTLHPLDVFTIPAGVIHRTRAAVRTVNLCFEEIAAETEFVDEK